MRSLNVVRTVVYWHELFKSKYKLDLLTLLRINGKDFEEKVRKILMSLDNMYVMYNLLSDYFICLVTFQNKHNVNTEILYSLMSGHDTELCDRLILFAVEFKKYYSYADMEKMMILISPKYGSFVFRKVMNKMNLDCVGALPMLKSVAEYYHLNDLSVTITQNFDKNNMGSLREIVDALVTHCEIHVLYKLRITSKALREIIGNISFNDFNKFSVARLKEALWCNCKVCIYKYCNVTKYCCNVKINHFDLVLHCCQNNLKCIKYLPYLIIDDNDQHMLINYVSNLKNVHANITIYLLNTSLNVKRLDFCIMMLQKVDNINSVCTKITKTLIGKNNILLSYWLWIMFDIDEMKCIEIIESMSFSIVVNMVIVYRDKRNWKNDDRIFMNFVEQYCVRRIKSILCDNGKVKIGGECLDMCKGLTHMDVFNMIDEHHFCKTHLTVVCDMMKLYKKCGPIVDALLDVRYNFGHYGEILFK